VGIAGVGRQALLRCGPDAGAVGRVGQFELRNRVEGHVDHLFVEVGWDALDRTKIRLGGRPAIS